MDVRRSMLLALAAGALGLLAGTAGAAEVTLKAASGFAEKTNFSKMFEAFIAKVNADAKGLVQINYVGGGEKVMNPFELGNAVRGGVVDIGNLPGAFYTNVMPEADALKMTDKTVTALKASGAYDHLNKLHNEKVNAVLLGRQKTKVPFHLYLNKPIDKMDLGGLKIRVTPIYNAFFASLGATTVRTAPGEVYTALERGVVDGYGWPIQGIFDLGWHEVTKYRVDPAFYSSAVEVLVNLTTWNKLDGKQKEALAKAAAWMEQQSDAEDAALNAAEAKRQADRGIKVIAFTGDQARQYLAKADASAWEAINKTSPQHGPRLRELLAK